VIAELLQEFLRQFKPSDYLAFDADAEEVKYLGADFAGGIAYFITADWIDTFSTSDWIRDQAKQFLRIYDS
jgi:hypothetical protein